MEKLSPITRQMQLPLDIPLSPYLQDHCFMGKAVFPAVEAMRVLAESLHSFFPEICVRHIRSAKFDRFLLIPPDQKSIGAIHDMGFCDNGEIISKLVTRIHSEKTGIARVREHVTLCFSASPSVAPDIPPEMPEIVSQEDCFEIPCQRIYTELVPFGPAYRNIAQNLILTEKDAVAVIRGGPEHLSHPDFSDSPLGSPFPADAAFHAACAWGQRYAGIVAFPVGLGARHILRPTRTNEKYKARCIPVKYEAQTLIFDMVLYDHRGKICEIIQQLQMQDISRGRMKAPDWIRFGNQR